MYELMEDFEEVLSRAPISVTSGQDAILSMGGIINGTSSIATVAGGRGAVAEEDCEASMARSSKSSQKQRVGRDDGDSERRDDPGAIFAAGNCLSSSCCYNNSSTESDTVVQEPKQEQQQQNEQRDQSKCTSKYKKQRERLLSRPTL